MSGLCRTSAVKGMLYLNREGHFDVSGDDGPGS
jgi:hypothetical protein